MYRIAYKLIILVGALAIAFAVNCLIVEAPNVQDRLFEYIALCESENNQKAKNPHSSASGRFQFLKTSWAYYGDELWGDELSEKDVFDWQDNTELAWYVYKKNGTVDWKASQHCWQKYL